MHTEAIGELVEKYVAACVAEAVEPVKADRDRLAGALAASEDELQASRAAAAEASSIGEALREQLARARADVDAGVALADQLRARIAELEADEHGEPPAPARPILGACPLTGRFLGRDNVIKRWGDGAAVRLFADGGFAANPAPDLGAAGRLLLSWKPDLSRPLVEAEVVAALRLAPAGSKVCVWHEPDVKARKGAAVAPMKARAREFYDIVKRNRPDLVVMAVLSGWTFEAGKGFDPLDYIERDAFDVLAVDLDGTEGPKDFRPVADNVAEFAASIGVGWTVGEFGTKLEPGFTNADRVPWLVEQTTYLIDMPSPPEEICLFEVDTTDGKPYILTTAAEIEAWQGLKAGLIGG